MNRSASFSPRTERRRLLKALGVLSALSAWPVRAAVGDHKSQSEFMTLSARLLKVELSELDPEQGKAILAALKLDGESAALTRVEAGPLSDVKLTEKIINAWYTGLYGGREGLVEVGYTSALIWTALKYTKPPGICGGETGYWGAEPK